MSLLRVDNEDKALSRGLSPGSLVSEKSQLEVELMRRNSIAYLVLQSIPLASLENSDLPLPVNMTREESQEHRPIITSKVSMFRIAVKASAILTLLTILLFDVFCVPIGSKRTPPGQIAKLCDEWLTKLDISVWTKVSIPSDLAARIISLYLETDHQLLGTFDPHQFVSNLVNHGDRYYSTFLPNTLLYWGSQAYSAVHKGANEYTKPPCQEAERLWSSGRHQDLIVDMVGAQIFSLTYMRDGKEHNV